MPGNASLLGVLEDELKNAGKDKKTYIAIGKSDSKPVVLENHSAEVEFVVTIG